MDSQDVRRQWAERTGEYSPEYYAYYGPDETSEAIRSILADRVGRSASVLELGCSSGRHLAALRDDGFDDLAGVEVNPDAFAVMEEHYPDLAEAGTFFDGAIEDVLPRFDDGQFDAIFSVETLQHVHPDAAGVFEDVARITGDVLITVENEGSPGERGTDDPGVNYVHDEFPIYYRDWSALFADLGMDEVATEEQDRDTRRVFQTADG
ncbi:MAG: class I SAM-dependent methyltransferase [Halanaeroarchaeum sp.]